MTDSSIVDLVNRAVEVTVQRAQRVITQPQYLYGSVVTVDASGVGVHDVLLDGDDEAVAVVDVGYPRARPGDRVALAFAPPHQLLVIGVVSPQPGPIARVRQTTNTPVWAVDSTTDLTLSGVSVVMDRTYEFKLHAQAEFATLLASARWVLEARVDSTVVGRFDSFLAPPGTYHRVVDSAVEWTATDTGTVTVDVFADEVVDGATLQLQASATIARWLTVKELGVVPE